MELMTTKMQPPSDSAFPLDTMVDTVSHTFTDIQESVRDSGDGDGLGSRIRSLDPNSKKRK